jgi:Cu(I)/Ag(I) efflux system membrane fusion protein
MKYFLTLGLVLVVVIGAWFVLRSVSAAKGATAIHASETPPTLSPQLWTCGMHPQVVQDHPGSCPICHMRLTPMRRNDEGAPSTNGLAAIVIDPAVVQNMGIRTAQVTRGPLNRVVRTVGVLEAPETGLHDISPKVGGWIDRLYANQEGMHVQKGDPLFDLYSPDLVVAQEELIAAAKAMHALGPTADASLKRSSEALVESAKRRLRLLDVSDDVIDPVITKLAATRTITFRSPASGAVIEKTIVQGSATQAGQKLMRIEDHSTLWLQLQVYEQQMPLVAVGDEVRATVDALPGETLVGRIVFVHPHVDPMSRTVMARAELENPEGSLKPGMYASAVIASTLDLDAVQVPREAVIDTGKRQIVFVMQSEGHFEQRVVRTGSMGDAGRVEILSGLSPGDTVVTSGQFLLDVESRTAEAIEKLRSTSAVPAQAAEVRQ